MELLGKSELDSLGGTVGGVGREELGESVFSHE